MTRRDVIDCGHARVDVDASCSFPPSPSPVQLSSFALHVLALSLFSVHHTIQPLHVSEPATSTTTTAASKTSTRSSKRTKQEEEKQQQEQEQGEEQEQEPATEQESAQDDETAETEPATTATPLVPAPARDVTWHPAHSFSLTFLFDVVHLLLDLAIVQYRQHSITSSTSTPLLGVVCLFVDWMRLHTVFMAPDVNAMPEAERMARLVHMRAKQRVASDHSDDMARAIQSRCMACDAINHMFV